MLRLKYGSQITNQRSIQEKYHRRIMSWMLIVLLCYLPGAAIANRNAEVPPPDEVTQVSILHTNDLHSQWRPDTEPPHLGGIARLKSKLDILRKKLPYSVLVDGGDWSEGSIYFTEGAIAGSIEMMEHLGYDVAVVGNHD